MKIDLMLELNLNKNSANLLCLLYSEYINRIKNGYNQDDASNFVDAQYIRRNFLQNLSIDDVCNACYELLDIDFLQFMSADDEPDDIVLTRKAITYMDNRFLHDANALLTLLSKLKA